MSAHTAVDAPSLARAPTQTAIVLSIVAAACLLMWPTIVSFGRLWSDAESLTYTHGFLIAAVCVWMLIRVARGDTARAPAWGLLAALVAGSILWLFGQRAGVELAGQLLFPLLVLLTLGAALGAPALRRYWFACAYFYFATSLWNLGNDALRTITVQAVKLLLLVSGVPAFVEGDIVHIPEGTFQIEGGCSGLHYFIVALALAALFGEIHRDRWIVRVRQIALAAALAMLGNWLRVYALVVIGHATDMQHYLVRVDHYYFGWVVFVFVMVPFFWLMSRTPVGSQPAAAAAPATPAPRGRVLAGCAAALAALALGPALDAAVTGTPQRSGGSARATTLPELPGWQRALPDADWQPQFPQADRSELGKFARASADLAAFVAEYDDQRQGKELVGYGNYLLAGLGAVTGEGVIVTPRGPARAVQVSGWPRADSIVVYSYRVGDTRYASGARAQLGYAWASLTGGAPSRVLAVRSTCAPDCGAARARARELHDALDAALAEPAR